MKKKLLSLAFRLGLLALCIVLITRLVDFQTVITQLKQASPSCVVIACLISLFIVVVSALRWKLLNPDPSGQWHFFDYFRYTMISNLFNIVMPGALGGDLVRSLYVVKEADGHKTANLFGMLVDRVVGVFSILLLGAGFALAAPDLLNRQSLLLAIALPLLAGLVMIYLSLNEKLNAFFIKLFSRFGKIGGKIGNILTVWSEVTHYYRKIPMKLLIAFALCFVMHGAWFLAVFLIAQNLGFEISFLSMSVITAISLVITAIPLTFGGLGVRELSYVMLLSSQHIGAEQATAFSLIQYGVYLIIALGGLPFLWMSKRGMVQAASRN